MFIDETLAVQQNSCNVGFVESDGNTTGNRTFRDNLYMCGSVPPCDGGGSCTVTSVREFLVDLARNEVPAGVVASEEALGGRGIPHDVRPASSKKAFRADMGSRVGRFNAVNTGFQAIEKAGIVHVRGVDEPIGVGATLESYVSVRNGSGIPVIEAVLKRVVGAVRGRELQGFVGTGSFPGPECPLDRPVNLPEGPTPLIALLDQIIRQVPGLVWLVTYEPGLPNNNLKVGLLCPDGASVKVTVY